MFVIVKNNTYLTSPRFMRKYGQRMIARSEKLENSQNSANSEIFHNRGRFMSDAIAARTALRIQNWAEIVAAQAESGLTIHEFCKNRGLSEGSYYYWLHKVRKHVLDTSSPTEEKDQTVQFAQLPMPAMPAHQVPLRRIEIDYGGFHVAVDADIPEDSLHRVLTVLKELDA